MSDWTATHSYKNREYNQTCDFCGCKFNVIEYKQDGHNDREEYWCPECGKEFSTWGSITPSVNIISGRTDGKTCRYENESEKS